MKTNLIMLSGIPRSGSQVLSSMINQHPEIYSSTTSPVVDLLDIINNEWPRLSSALVNPDKDQLKNIVGGMIDGAYEHINKPVIVDKNRIWPRHGSLMTDVIGSKPKIICTVRPIPEVLASYILLVEKNKHKLTYIDHDLIVNDLAINNKNRCKILWEKYINAPYTSLRIGYNAGFADLCLISYHDIVNNSQQVMDTITKFIGIDTFTINPDNMQPMQENDSYHGGLDGLHDVRPILKRTSPPAEKVIGHELVKLYTEMQLDFWNR